MNKKVEMTIWKNPLMGAKPSVKSFFGGVADGSLKKGSVIIGTEKDITSKPKIYMEFVDDDHWIGLVNSFKLAGKEMSPDDVIAQYGNMALDVEFTDGSGSVEAIGTLKVVPEKKAGKGGYTLTEKETAAVKRVLDKGLSTKELMDQRLQVMADNGILKDEDLVVRCFNQYRKYNKSPMIPHTIYQDPYDYKLGEAKLLHQGLREALGHNALVLKGPKSVGKNCYTDTLAFLLGKPEGLETFSRSMSPSRIYGDRSTDNTAADLLEHFDSTVLREAKLIHEKHRVGALGKVVEAIGKLFGKTISFGEDKYTDEELAVLQKEADFEKLKAEAASVHLKIETSEFIAAVEDGWVLALNEMNMAEANFFASFMNPLLDGTGYINVPGRGEVPISKDLVVVGTQNDDYEGTESQNDATISRFGAFRFQQPKSVWKLLKAATESNLRKRGSVNKLDDSVYLTAERFYQQVKQTVDEGSSDDSYTSSSITDMALNIRGLVRALTEYADGKNFTTLKNEIRIHVINTCPTDDALAIENILLATVNC